jgi:hypothetical protein
MSQRFTLAPADWAMIESAVAVLGFDANLITLARTSRNGTVHETALRSTIEQTATIHLLRDKALRRVPTQKAYRDSVLALREDAKRLHTRIANLPAFWVTINGHETDRDMLVATDVYFDKLLRNLEDARIALGPERKKTGGGASTKSSRDFFWTDLLAIWREIGGEETGVAAARFLEAVSPPVMAEALAVSRESAVPPEKAIIKWLERRSKAKPAKPE